MKLFFTLTLFCTLLLRLPAQSEGQPVNAEPTSNYFISAEGGLKWNSIGKLIYLKTKVPFSAHVNPSADVYLGYNLNHRMSFAVGFAYSEMALCYRDSIARYTYRGGAQPQTYYSPELYETYISRSYCGVSARWELNAYEDRYRYGLMLSVSGGVTEK